MTDLQKLLLASIALGKQQAEIERLREENASLRRILEGDVEFDLSGDDLPALLRRQAE